MLIALTFLGTGEYKETTYIKHDDQDQQLKTDLFPIAVAELYKPDRIIAFTTERVRDTKQNDLQKIQEKVGNKFTTQDIPNGNSPDELWEIFNNCISVFKDEENDTEMQIILDITHAFRSIPLLIFIVAAYLRQVKNVELKHIIYGAFEARDMETDQTPIFDLTPFVDLLDWMNAVNVFQNSGDARPIAKLDVRGDIAPALTRLSNALLTNRTLEAQRAAMDFNQFISDDLQQPPFQMLVDQLKQSYWRMAVYEPSNSSENSLKAQYHQIKWYVENQHYLQAITLMREWLISWKCVRDEQKWLNMADRKSAEEKLNERAEESESPLATQLKPLATDTTSIDLWKKCVDIRNDLAHCGMRYEPEEAAAAIEKTLELFSEFETFVEPS